ncbi:FAD:protein FMN transferase [Williamsia sp. CHRR-6]|nr:FAD:protein FMN transferase [Williamsia sp. CHRR-6]
MQASLTVTDPAALHAARRIVDDVIAEVDRAASRFRPDAELYSTAIRRGRPTRISPMLAQLVDTALAAARASGGAVDPTVGRRLVALGYDRDLRLVREGDHLAARPMRVTVTDADHTMITRHGDTLTVPEGVLLDLGATAKAAAADIAADRVAAELGGGVLVNLGGDLTVRGDTPEGGWQIRIDDGPDQPATQIGLVGDCAVATSSTLQRRWRSPDGQVVHHILDPRSGAPAPTRWRTVTVVARRCVDANTLTTGAIVKGDAGLAWVQGSGLAARLVGNDGSVIGVGGWPDEQEQAA